MSAGDTTAKGRGDERHTARKNATRELADQTGMPYAAALRQVTRTGTAQQPAATAKARPKDYGPVQFPARLGLPPWAFQRALRDGLIPAADPGSGRWPAAVVDAAVVRLDRIKAAVGPQPDVGAVRAAEVLSERFGLPVDPGVLLELDRRDLIPCAGHYKGHPVYDGRALEKFGDRGALDRAMAAGRLLTRDEAARYLQIRHSDVAHLVTARWLEPVTWVRSGWQRRSSAPEVPLFRAGDLDILLAHPAIDWDDVRGTPAGRPSPLARLTARSPRR